MYQAAKQTRTNVESIALLNDVLEPLDGGSTPISGGFGVTRKSPNPELANPAKIVAKRVVLASSRAVYGEAKLSSSGQPTPSREDDSPEPRSIYGVTKLAQERMLFVGFKGIEKCALRFQNVYGEGQSLANPYTGVASVFVQAALNNQDIFVFSDGGMIRDFIHVEDAVRALEIAVTGNTVPHALVNVGTGIPTSLLSLARMIVALAGSSSRISVTGETLAGDIRANFADIARLESIGFRAAVQLEDGLLSLLNWARSVSSDGNSHRYNEVLEELRSKGILSNEHHP
jgi:dTDP-L-rhamnose 4-epimerase